MISNLKNYIKAYDDPTNKFHKEVRGLADRLRTDTVLTLRGIDKGVLRWKSNNAVVPFDCAQLARFIGIRISITACRRVRDRELAEFFSEYRDSCADKDSPEELSKICTSFGKGKVVSIRGSENENYHS